MLALVWWEDRVGSVETFSWRWQSSHKKSDNNTYQPFLPIPLCITVYSEHWQLWQVTAESLYPSPVSWNVREILHWPYRTTLVDWLAPALVQRPECFHSLLRTWNLTTQVYGNPGRPQLAAVEMATAKPSVTTPWGKSCQEEEGSGQGWSPGSNQFPLDFKCSWRQNRRYCSSNQGQQECQGKGRMRWHWGQFRDKNPEGLSGKERRLEGIQGWWEWIVSSSLEKRWKRGTSALEKVFWEKFDLANWGL